MEAIFSYAGRTENPRSQPLPTRIGGFGGAAGLVAFLRSEAITHVVDATHPFAARMSANAVVACTATGTALMALERPAWPVQPGWERVADIAAAVQALPEAPARVFLAIGRQHLAAFAVRPQHHYLLRFVDPPTHQPLPMAEAVIGRGPFTPEGDKALMVRHGTDILVAKNAGGDAARAKLDAAGALGLRVILIDRPYIPPRPVAGQVGEVMAWLNHTGPARRGV